MLFNSYIFIFLFLPFVLAGFYFLKPSHRMGFLIFVSIIFYAKWHLAHLLLLLVSVSMNYMIARTMVMSVHKKTLLGVGIGIGLFPLIYFKYSSFLHLSTHSLVLPLAISFYTFQQIAFLVDLYRKQITLGSFDKYLFLAMSALMVGIIFLSVQQYPINAQESVLSPYQEDASIPNNSLNIW